MERMAHVLTNAVYQQLGPDLPVVLSVACLRPLSLMHVHAHARASQRAQQQRRALLNPAEFLGVQQTFDIMAVVNLVTSLLVGSTLMNMIRSLSRWIVPREHSKCRTSSKVI